MNRPPVPLPSWVNTPLTAMALQIVPQNVNSPRAVSAEESNDAQDVALLATAVIDVEDAHGTPVTLRAVCDGGSHVNMITQAALRELSMADPSNPVVVRGIGNQTSTLAGTVELKFVSHLNDDQKFEMTAFVIEEISTNLPQQQLPAKTWPHLSKLPLADPTFNVPGKIDILLGAPAYGDIMCQGLKRGSKNQPVAQCTHIGWIVFGKIEIPHSYPRRSLADAANPFGEASFEMSWSDRRDHTRALVRIDECDNTHGACHNIVEDEVDMNRTTTNVDAERDANMCNMSRATQSVLIANWPNAPMAPLACWGGRVQKPHSTSEIIGYKINNELDNAMKLWNKPLAELFEPMPTHGTWKVGDQMLARSDSTPPMTAGWIRSTEKGIQGPAAADTPFPAEAPWLPGSMFGTQ